MSRELLRINHKGRDLLILWSSNTDSPVGTFRGVEGLRAWLKRDRTHDLDASVQRQIDAWMSDLDDSERRLNVLVEMNRLPSRRTGRGRSTKAEILRKCVDDADSQDDLTPPDVQAERTRIVAELRRRAEAEDSCAASIAYATAARWVEGGA